ncbi:mesenchyme-specific cell surface glycoprotein-like [Anneissia japonica]|uniref:mesenchyme-specific cell surface glycoprotein-like n=1 Tax=Anneissia japonica TaxID=1529436 RepID=UPI00142583A9|nr:mesenchyme-specific cell surface glycoprotein-like [Anneissia japonica]
MILIGILYIYGCVYVSEAVIGLSSVSSLYMPYDYAKGKGVYDFNRNAVEETAYDVRNKLIYTAGSRYLHIVDVSKPTKPIIIHKHRLTQNVEDIAICGNYFAMIQEHKDFPALDGFLKIFKVYNPTTHSLDRIHTIKGKNDEDINRNPPNEPTKFAGSELPKLPCMPMLPQFTVHREFEYIQYGIRKPYAPSSLSMNLEPESIAFNNDETKLYVTLQENNAVLTIDMATKTLESVFSLGAKQWANLRLDASSGDGGTKMRKYPIYSLYQPDGLAYFENNGEGYVITANEGADVELDQGGVTFHESERASTMAERNMFSKQISPDLLKSLGNNRQLGQLEISQIDGLDEQGKIKTVFFYGGRGFSIWRASDMHQVYDSGDEVALKHKQYFNSIFNADSTTRSPTNNRPTDLKDVRSDNKGVECESIVMGEAQGKRLIFIAIDRVSTIMVYSLPAGSTKPVFESIFRGGRLDKTFQELYKNMEMGDLRPSDMMFLDAKDSPNNSPMLMVTGRASGTISLYHVGNVINNSSSRLKADTTTWTLVLHIWVVMLAIGVLRV